MLSPEIDVQCFEHHTAWQVHLTLGAKGLTQFLFHFPSFLHLQETNTNYLQQTTVNFKLSLADKLFVLLIMFPNSQSHKATDPYYTKSL